MEMASEAVSRRSIRTADNDIEADETVPAPVVNILTINNDSIVDGFNMAHHTALTMQMPFLCLGILRKILMDPRPLPGWPIF